MGVNVIEIGNSYLDNVSPRDVSYCGIIVFINSNQPGRIFDQETTVLS